MRKLRKISLIVLIPLLGGLLCLFIGGGIGNETVSYIGSMLLSIGVPVTMFVLVVVCLVLVITGKLSLSDKEPGESVYDYDDDDDDDEEMTETDKESAKIEDINSSYGLDSRMKEGAFIGDHVANNYKNSSDKEKVLGWLFFGFLIGDFALILVFAFLHIMIGVFVCMGIFAGTILTALLVKVILEKTSMRVNRKRLKAEQITVGAVKACLLSSTSGTGNRTVRVHSVIYRIIIVAEGKEYTAYSDKFYETDDEVAFAIIGKNRASIL